MHGQITHPKQMVDPIFSATTGELYQFLALMDKE